MAADKAIWFENGRHRLKDPQELQTSHQNFRRKVKRVLRKGHFKQEKEEYHIATTKEELNLQIEEIRDGHNARGIALQRLGNAEKTHEAYLHDRQHGPKRVGRWAQEFASTFADFLSAYSGIIDIVKSAGAPYGEIAYQSLSILLVVVVNKSNNDKRIMELLDDLRKSFPRLDSWNQIYPTDEMRDLVAAVYNQVTEFSMAVAEYFARFWTRIWVALIAPPSVGIDRITASIHKNLAEINAEAMFGLHNRSQNIETEVVNSGKTIKQLKLEAEESSRAIKRMEATNEELLLSLKEQREKMNAYVREVERKQALEDEQRMRAFQEDLGIRYPSPEMDVNTCRETLMRNFPNATSYVQRTPATAFIQMNPTLLHETKTYQSWLSYPGSSFLFISGTTSPEGRRFKGLHDCWLSPATVYIAEKLEKEKQRYIFYSCYPELDSESTKSAHQIFSSILLRLLEWKPEILREKGVQLRKEVVSKPWHDTAHENIMIQTMMRTLQDVLYHVRDLGPLYIIIDRLDIYEGKLHFIADEMVRLVNTMDKTCQVKMVVVAETNPNFDRGKWNPDYLPEDELEYDLSRVFVQKDWKQRRRPLHELSSGHFPLTWGEGLP